MSSQHVLVTLTSSGEVTYRDTDACSHAGPLGLLGDQCPECQQLVAEGRWDPDDLFAAEELERALSSPPDDEGELLLLALPSRRKRRRKLRRAG